MIPRSFFLAAAMLSVCSIRTVAPGQIDAKYKIMDQTLCRWLSDKHLQKIRPDSYLNIGQAPIPASHPAAYNPVYG
jgi:hypothetical protein